jgi:hypothetical protein
MGYPVDDFALFDAIINGKNQTLADGYSEQLQIKPFKAYAFILHHPQIHLNFNKILNTQFEMLDQITGKDLLFFSISTPPEKWFKKAAKRDYFNFTSYKNRKIEDNINSSLGAILTSLGLDFDYLPCIILTKSMRQKDWHIIRVDEGTISPILYEFGQWAKDNGNTNFLPLKINNTPLTPISSREKLSKLLSPGINANFANSYGVAKSLSNININEIQNTIQKCRELIGNKDFSINEHLKNLNTLDQLLLYILHLQAARIDKTIFEDHFPEIKEEYLEGNSNIIYKSLRYWQSLAYDPPLKEFDYSPGIVSASKILEIEQSKSLVQWARGQMGVLLPEYYCRYCPQAGPCIVGSKENPIDFNYQRNGKWIPPTLGNGLNGIRQLIKRNELPNGYEKNVIRELLRPIDSLVNLRNPAAHSRPMNKMEWKTASESFLSFIKKDGFKKYYSIKTLFKLCVPNIISEPIHLHLKEPIIKMTGVHFNKIKPKTIPEFKKIEISLMKKEKVDEILEQIFANKYSSERELLILYACGYYLDKNTPDEVKNEINLLWSTYNYIEYQKDLKQAIINSTSKNIRLDTGLDRIYDRRGDFQPPQEITINPTITISECNYTELINEYKRIDLELQKKSLNISLLLSFIKERAIKSGEWKWQ